MEFKIDKKVLMRIFLCVLGCIVFYWVLHGGDRVQTFWSFLADIFAPFVMGGALAFVFNVPLRFFERRAGFVKNLAVRRAAAITMTVVAILLVIALVMVLLVPQLEKTILSLVEQLPAFFENLDKLLNTFLSEHPELREMLGIEEGEIRIDWMNVVKLLTDALSGGFESIFSSAVAVVSGTFSAVFNMIISVIFAFYCLAQKETLARQGRKLLYATIRKERADCVVRIFRMTNSAFSNFFTGQCLVALILALLFVPAMLIFRMPYIPLICVVIAVTALIPMVGAFAGCILGGFLILVYDPMLAFTYVIMFLLIQQFENNVIYPRVVGKSVGLPGMWVLLAVAVGGGLFGVPGMLLMVPVVSVIYTLVIEYVRSRLAEKEIDEECLMPQPPELQPHFVFTRKKKDKADKKKTDNK